MSWNRLPPRWRYQFGPNEPCLNSYVLHYRYFILFLIAVQALYILYLSRTSCRTYFHLVVCFKSKIPLKANNKPLYMEHAIQSCYFHNISLAANIRYFLLK